MYTFVKCDIVIDRVYLSRTLYLDTGRFNTSIFTYQRTSEDSIKCAYNCHGVSIRVFSDYIDIDFCNSLIKEKYRDFIDEYSYNSFYWYNDGAEIIDNAVTLSAKDKLRLREYWLSLSQGSVDRHFRAPSTRKKYNDMLASREEPAYL